MVFIVLGFLFFIATSWHSVGILQGGAVKFNSPYDTSSYFFITQFIKEKKIGYYEPYLALSNNLAHPRSMSEYHGFVVPTIFLGFLIILGLIGFVVGPYGVLFIVPACAALTPYFFYQLLLRLFSRRVAVLSALLLFFHPAYWYYASRSMLPNILLVDVLIFGFTFFCASCDKKNSWFAALAGLCIGMALAIRPIEVLWILPLCAIGLWYLRKRISLKIFSITVLSTAFVAGVYAFFNYNTFGNIFSFGYKIESFSPSLSSSPLHIIFPFGFHPRLVFYTFWNYAASLQWWFVIPACIGFFMMLPRFLREISRGSRTSFFYYTLCFLLTSSWLLLSYGSFEFSENVTRQFTLGDSHVRYWLPIFILSLPYFSLALITFFSMVSRWITQKILLGFLMCGPLFLCAFLSARLVYWQTNESLIPLLEHIHDYQRKSKVIQSLVPSHAIIFSPSSDKIFFPERKAAASFPKFAEVSSIVPLMRSVPVYYYGLWGFTDLQKINEEYFRPHGFELQLIAQLDAKEKLFKVIPVSK